MVSLPQSTLEQITPLAAQKRKKRQKGDNGALVMGGTPSTQLSTLNIDQEYIQVVKKTFRETQLGNQPVIIGSQVTTSYCGSKASWECSFQLGDKSLPSISYLLTWRSGKGGHVFDCLGQALLFSADMEHYASCRVDDLVLKLKWYTVVVYFVSCMLTIIILYLSLLFHMLLL